MTLLLIAVADPHRYILDSSFPQDHERIRGGLYFLESIPRDENWKVLKDALKEYKSIKEEKEEEEEEVIYDEYSTFQRSN